MNLNWETEWEKRFDQREAMYTGKAGLEYWEARAADFSELRVSRDYAYGRKVLEILEPLLPDQAEVMDVGAGPGTFLVPFAPRSRQFTAVEPAENMVAMLEKNARAAGVSNFRVILSPWQTIDLEPYKKRFDLVMVSITLWIFRDIWQQIERMEQTCKGYCTMVTGAGFDGPKDDGASLWEAIVGDAPNPGYTEFPFIFNLLYKKGRYPEVRYLTHRAERTVETRIQQQKLFFSKYVTLTPAQNDLIREHVEKTAVNGMFQEEYTSAVVWWKPDP